MRNNATTTAIMMNADQILLNAMWNFRFRFWISAFQYTTHQGKTRQQHIQLLAQ
jgi:hypothetical protein